MKKRFYVFSMLAAGMLLAGCSDDLEGGQDGPNVVEGVTGYARLALNLPTDGATTRAANDQFADGLPDEYKVNDGIIAFFTGPETGSDEEATFVKAYELGNLEAWSMVDDDPNQITSRRVIVQEAPVPATGNRLYALVILNPNSVVSVEYDGNLKVGSTTYKAEGAKKIGDIRTFLTGQTVDAYIKTGTSPDTKPSFLMTNAPLANKSIGEDLVVQTLVPVTIYDTQAEAEGAKNPDEIYVERAVAKVTLKGFSYDAVGGGYTKNVTPGAGNVYNGDKVTLTGWILNTTNKSTALVRNVTDYKTWNTTDYNTDGSTNRFFGGSPVATDTYRVYWAIDDNYEDETEKSDFTIYEEDTSLDWNENTEDKSDDKSYPLYCLENTMSMDEAAGDDDVITSVLLKTTYNFGDGATAEDFFIVTNTPMKKDAFLEYVNEQMGYDESNKLTKIEGEGKIVDTADEVKTLFGLSGADADTKAEAILAKLGTIKYYRNGSNYYYAARIKHFGDTYTLDPRDPNVAESNKTDAKCLGYYGVVRNNWYEITIKSISGPGEPEITPPADNYGYINATINILSWAKREQSVDL